MAFISAISQREDAYREMLIELDKLITDSELSRMKFRSKAVGIGDRNLQSIESSIDLWQKLEERGQLSSDNLEFLKKLLTSCTDNRQDVLRVIAQYEAHPQVKAHLIPGEHEDVSKEITFLVDNLGKDWKFFMRALGLSEPKLEMCVGSYPRDMREQICKAFSEWKLNGSPSRNSILQALKEISRNDLYNSLA